VTNSQTGFLTNFETFLIKKLKYVNTSWRAADNWSEGRMRPTHSRLDSPVLVHCEKIASTINCDNSEKTGLVENSFSSQFSKCFRILILISSKAESHSHTCLHYSEYLTSVLRHISGKTITTLHPTALATF
jgi:hypothetical protein